MSNWAAIGALGTAAEGAGNYFGIIAKEKIVSQRLAEARSNKLADTAEARKYSEEMTVGAAVTQAELRETNKEIDLKAADVAYGVSEERRLGRNATDAAIEVEAEAAEYARDEARDGLEGNQDERVGTSLQEGPNGVMYAQYITNEGETYVLPVRVGKPSNGIPEGGIPVAEGQTPADAIAGAEVVPVPEAVPDPEVVIAPAYSGVEPSMQETAQKLGGDAKATDYFKGKMSASDQARQDDALKLIYSVGNMKKILSPGEDGEPGYDPTGWGGLKDQLFAGGWTNFAASADGQVFQREAIDASETLLRLATGAAAPQPEVERYRQLYVPEAWDDAATVAAKMAGLDNMIDVLGGLKSQYDQGNITATQYANAVENGFLESEKVINQGDNPTVVPPVEGGGEPLSVAERVRLRRARRDGR